MRITFEIDTNMTPEKIKEVLVYLVDNGEIALEGTLKDYADIDADSITVVDNNA